MSGAKQVLRNVGWLAVARGAFLGIGMVVTVILARVLGPGHYGILGFGTALVSYFQLLSTLGFEALGTREVARTPERMPELVSHIVSIRLLLGVGGYALYLLVVLLMPLPPSFGPVLAVQGLLLVVNTVSLEWVYYGLERMHVLAGRFAAAGILNLIGVLVLVRGPEDVLLAAALSVLSLAVAMSGLVVRYRRDFGPLRPRVDTAAWRALLRPAITIAASSFMIAIYYNLDKVMLGFLRTSTEVGLYEAAYKVLGAAIIPASIVSQAFFSRLSATYGDERAMNVYGEAHARAMIGLGTPVAVAGLFLARPVIALLYGPDYVLAGPVLAILLLNGGLVYASMSYGQPLLAWDRQRALFISVTCGAVLNVVLNFVLIPLYGTVGAAWATLGAEATVMLAMGVQHFRLIRSVYGGVLIRAVPASLIGVGGPLLLVERLAGGLPAGAFLALAIPAAAGGYALAAWATGLIDVQFLRLLRDRASAPEEGPPEAALLQPGGPEPGPL